MCERYELISGSIPFLPPGECVLGVESHRVLLLNSITSRSEGRIDDSWRFSAYFLNFWVEIKPFIGIVYAAASKNKTLSAR